MPNAQHGCRFISLDARGRRVSMSAATPSLKLRAPPRINETQVSKPLQDLFASWREALREPFRGITADGEIERNLFSKRTGGNVAPIVDAATRFLAALSAGERNAVTFSLDSEVWRHWSNIHRNLQRHGLCLVELSEHQRELVYDFLSTSLGKHAYETARKAMKLNQTLAEMTGLPLEFGEFFYWISFFGTPSRTEPWGWQLDGHHCNVNCLVASGQIVLSPILLGSEPVTAEAGIYEGMTVLREEEAEGWTLMQTLTPEQRKKATIGMDLPFDGYASGFKDNIIVPYTGLPVGEMSPQQRKQLIKVIALYTDRLPQGHAEARLEEVLARLDRTVFAWIGEFDAVSPFYYRIYSPVIFIEFYHQPGVALPNTGYNRRHAHATMRTPNGNDYGKALLKLWRA
jgi:hypothetical protein